MTVRVDAAAHGDVRVSAKGRGAVRAAARLLAIACLAPGLSGSLQAGQTQASAAMPASGARNVGSYVTYITRNGDTLYDIAGRYLRDPRDWAVLSRLNHVSAPRRMPAGIALRLPADRLRQNPESARVIATSGPADHAFGNGPYVPLVQGATLGEGDHIRTGHDGFVTLELPDGSHVTLTQDGMLDVGSLRRTVLTGSADRILQLHRGEVQSEVTHATKKDDRFQIRSPSVVAGVRGTRFKVAYDGDTRITSVEVLDGAVGVDPAARHDAPAIRPGMPLQASAQLVKARFGSVTRTGDTVGAPLALLPAPALIAPAKVQDGKTVAFDLVPTEGAQAYRVQIARDADQLDLIRDLRVSAPQADFDDLADGTYFVRIAAIDAHGLEGLPQVYAFERRQVGLAASGAPRAGSRDYEFRWFVSRSTGETRFRFVLAATADLRQPIVDRTDLSGGELVVSDLPAGVYYWTIVAEQFDNGRFYETSSAVRSFTLAQ
ncbi:hypothetical protein P3T18_006746 [Paraburkholderia sp. GAS199]|uniref:FecR domain-containing protein n=1 Tax=Paraburkholderia sp. GAS199 TaxID=3035126 RepID=UPI003D2099B1